MIANNNNIDNNKVCLRNISINIPHKGDEDDDDDDDDDNNNNNKLILLFISTL